MLLHLSVAEAPATSNELYVVGLSQVDLSGREEWHSYWVDWAYLPGKVSWCPEREQLPLELDKAALRARAFLAKSKGITYPLELVSLQIERLACPVSEQLSAHHKTAVDFTNRWFLTLHFEPDQVKGQSNAGRRKEYVVMLLDGTYGQERPLREPKWNMAPLGAGRSARKESSDLLSKPGSADGPTKRNRPDELAPLGVPDLPASAIQWTDGSPFPVSLSQQTKLLKGKLAAKFGASGDCFLREITINTFVHEAAQSGRKLSPPAMLHEWLLYYYFIEPSSSAEAKYRVLTMLDGTIVEMKLLAR